MVIVWAVLAAWTVLVAPAINADRYEGDSCPLANGAGNGVCRHHAFCPSLRTTPQKDWVTCSFISDQPIVCCQDTGLTDRTKNNTVVVSRSSSIAERECDKFPLKSALVNHIFGGIEAELNEFPYIAALGYPTSGRDETPFRCGASLISYRFLLTAAHCLSPTKPSFARFGVVKLNGHDPNDPDPPIDVKIAETFSHPNYTARPKVKHDIALLLLNRTITEEFLHPACLYTNPTDPDTETLLMIAGWGSTDPNDSSSISPVLLKANVTTIFRDTCNSTLAQNKSTRRGPTELHEGQLCALGRNATTGITISDTCVGDSGGPMELADGRRRYIVGVTSIGKLCGSRYPGIYTRVSQYLDWIESVVWPPGGIAD